MLFKKKKNTESSVEDEPQEVQEAVASDIEATNTAFSQNSFESTEQVFDVIGTESPADTEDVGPKHAAPKKKSKVAKVLLTILGALVGLVGVGYLAGAIAFNFIALPQSSLSGEDVSLKSFSSIASEVGSRSSSYATTITSDDFKLDLTSSEVGLSFDEDVYAQGLASQQNPWVWPFELTSTHDIESVDGASVDESKLKSLLSSAVEEHNKTATQPTDATIGYVESEGGFAVVPEVLGTALDLDSTLSFVKSALAGLPDTIKLDDTCKVQASVTSEDKNLAKAVQNANVYLKADIPLTLGGLDAGSITKAQISEWVVLDENQNATLDETKLAEWVKNNIAAKFDTAGSARTYTRADGKVVTVDAATRYWGNYYGWITDEEALVKLLVEAIKAGSTDTIDVPTKQTANAVPDENGRDWGNRYIDCDLTEQYVRMYDDSGTCIWESACVTGNTSTGYNTPAGVYFLNSNRSSGDVELRGKIDPETGEPSYISHVQYWMPFIDNSYAFHDANWRSNFGGSIYTYGGSHGCVNLPSGKAAELYGICQVGDVVVVHY